MWDILVISRLNMSRGERIRELLGQVSLAVARSQASEAKKLLKEVEKLLNSGPLDSVSIW